MNQIEWMSVREKAEDGNYLLGDRGRRRPPFLHDHADHRRRGRGLLEWTPPDAGEYKIEATGRDSSRPHHPQRGLSVGQRPRLYAVARGEQRPHQPGGRQEEYKVGDTAEILVPSPYQGAVKALLTTERGSVLSHEVIELAGNSEIVKVPITADHAPNVFVSLVLVKGMDGKTPPSFKMGLVGLKVSTADKQLQVIVTPSAGERLVRPCADGRPDRSRPRDAVTWTVQTLDAAGQAGAADVSLGAGGQGGADPGRRPGRHADGSLLQPARAGRADRRARWC